MTKVLFRPVLAVMLLTGVGTGVGVGAAQAGDDWVPPVRDALTRAECGTCHMTFQPAFLPARSWNAMMDTLSDHFGDDASLPPEKVEAIRAVLVAGAGRDRRPQSPAPLRITETRWFVHEHDFSPARWQRPGVVTKSNCVACHKGAEQGYYEDD